jgi:uncharacterized membrane protein YhhN
MSAEVETPRTAPDSARARLVDPTRRSPLFALAALAAAGWWATLLFEAVPTWAVGLKALAVLPLAALAIACRPGAGPLLGLALLVHSCGDLLLEVAPFLVAVATFGVGHLIYAAMFARARRPWDEVAGGAKLALGGLALALGVLLPTILAAAPVELRLPVGIYALVLGTMAALAQVSGRGQPWIAAGALAYVASDALLGLHLFGGSVPAGRALIWPLYWCGQAAIALGWIGSRRHPSG